VAWQFRAVGDAPPTASACSPPTRRPWWSASAAEGIEQRAQARELERLGCRFGQGFHFARPLDQFAVEALLVAEQGRRRATPASRARSRS
jgi:predicted signal transduction protein with EAL and GGDEF domain